MADTHPPANTPIIANGKTVRAMKKHVHKLNTNTSKHKAGEHNLAKHNLIHGEVPHGR